MKAVATGTVPYPLLETLQVRYHATGVRYRIRGFIHYRYGTVSLTASRQQYGTVSRFQSAIGTVPWLKLLGELEWPCCLTDMSVTFLQSSVSLSHLSQPTGQTRRADHTEVSSPSVHKLMSTNIRSFHVHFSIGTLSAEVRLKYSLSASESASRLSHDTPTVWRVTPVAGYLLKNWRFNRKCTEIFQCIFCWIFSS